MVPVSRDPSFLFRITPRCDTVRRSTLGEVNLTISQTTKIRVIVPRVISSVPLGMNRARLGKSEPPSRCHSLRHSILCILTLYWLIPRDRVFTLPLLEPGKLYYQSQFLLFAPRSLFHHIHARPALNYVYSTDASLVYNRFFQQIPVTRAMSAPFYL